MTIPEDVVEVPLKPILINGRKITKAIIDLRHINYGKRGIYPRSSLSESDVLELIFKLQNRFFLNGIIKGGYEYFCIKVSNKDFKPFRISFCLYLNEPSIGIITVYRIRDSNEKN